MLSLMLLHVKDIAMLSVMCNVLAIMHSDGQKLQHKQIIKTYYRLKC